MRGLPAVAPGASHRTRRWDAVVLGGALPGLVAAIRLGQHGLRVLVVEERASRELPDAVREPFLVTSAEPDGVLGSLLRAIQIPLIDLRSIGTEPVAYQVTMPGARVDVGSPARTAAELVAWGLAKPDDARLLVNGLGDAALAEREAMLASEWVRAPRRRFGGGRLRAIAAPKGREAQPRCDTGARGLPDPVRDARGPLATFLECQVRALSHTGDSTPAAECRARLLGAALLGSAAIPGQGGLRGHLRRRIESLHGEFRILEGPFHLVDAGQQGGIALVDTGEIWAGRALIVNAPRRDLADASEHDDVPEGLRGAAPARRRVVIHFSVPTQVLPEGMARRVIHLADGARPAETVALRVVGGGPTSAADVFASVAAPDTESGRSDAEASALAAVASLMPFSEGRITHRRLRAPRWDHDAALVDAPVGVGWPAESEILLGTRPRLYALERAFTAGLGSEGDLLLGWRAGDAIAGDLA